LPTRSVHAIDIDDSAFQRFAQMFAQYQKMLRDTPDAWRKIGQAADGTLGKITGELGDVENATEGVGKAASGMAVSFQQTFTNVNNYAGTLRRIGTQQGAIGHTVEAQARLWRDMGRYTHTFAQNIGGATRSLLEWGKLTGLITGLVGGGGLFGISRLATNTGTARRDAAGLGTNIGALRAFETDISRLVEPRQFLSGVTEAMMSPAASLPLVTSGVKSEGRSSTDVGLDLLRAIKKTVDATPTQFLHDTMHNMGYDRMVSDADALRMKRMSPKEVDQILGDAGRDTKTFNIPDRQAKVWQDLATQLTRAGTAIETSFTNKLVALAAPLGNLSDAVVKSVDTFLGTAPLKKWIDSLSTGVQWLAEYMAKPAFQTDINNFAEGLETFGKTMLEVGKDLFAFEQTVKKLFTGDWSPGKGGVNGPITDDNPNAPGSPAFYKAHPEIPKPSWWDTDENPGDQGGGSSGRSWWNWGKPLPWAGGPLNQSYEPRGIRNNNPLNIKYVGQEDAVPEAGGGPFAAFRAQESGFAAAERQLLRYQDRGLDTISKIVSTWAPSNENDTGAYIAEVSRRTGIGANDRVDFRNEKTADAIISAMGRHETGRDFDADTVSRGVRQGLGQQTVTVNGRPAVTTVRIENATGGNAVVSASQLSS
jgi:hypothetical protein